MGKIEDATATQLANIEARTGTTIAALIARLHAAGLEKHGQMVAWLKKELGLGHGDANLVAHKAREAPASEAAGGAPDDPADAWYSGKKAEQRPIHDALLARIATFGSDIEHSPKKAYLSLRRAKQFAMIGPAARGTVEVGVNLKGEAGDGLMEALPPGKMCTHRVRIGSVEEVSDALIGWLRRAYDAAG